MVWLLVELAYLDHLDVRFVQELVIARYLSFASEVLSDDVELGLGRSECEGDVFCTLSSCSFPLLEGLAFQDFSWRETLVAIVVKEDKIARIDRLLNGLVRPVPPIDSIVHIAWPGGVLLALTLSQSVYSC